MKRIISACLEQTQRFETENDYQTYIKRLERKRIKFKILEKQVQSDNTVMVKVRREYNNYPIGSYLN